MRHTAMPRTGGHQDGHAMASVTEGLKREQVPFMARVYCFWKGRWMPVLLCCVGEARSSLVLAARMLCKQSWRALGTSQASSAAAQRTHTGCRERRPGKPIMPDADDDDGAAGDERPDADGGPLPCACVYARLAWREKWLSDGEAACLTGSGSRQRDGSEEDH